MQNHAHFAQCMALHCFTTHSTPVGTLAKIYERGQRVTAASKTQDQTASGSRPRPAAARCLSLASGRIGVAGARSGQRCWARARAQSKKKFNADFSSKRTGSNPPPPPQRTSFV